MMLCTEKGGQGEVATTFLPWSVRVASLGAVCSSHRAPQVPPVVREGVTMTTKGRE